MTYKSVQDYVNKRKTALTNERTSFISHWKDILGELQKAGFEPKLIRYNAKNSKEFCGTLTVGALKL